MFLIRAHVIKRQGALRSGNLLPTRLGRRRLLAQRSTGKEQTRKNDVHLNASHARASNGARIDCAGTGLRCNHVRSLAMLPQGPVLGRAKCVIRGPSARTSVKRASHSLIDMRKVRLDSTDRCCGEVASASDIIRRCGLRISRGEPTSDNAPKPGKASPLTGGFGPWIRDVPYDTADPARMARVRDAYVRRLFGGQLLGVMVIFDPVTQCLNSSV